MKQKWLFILIIILLAACTSPAGTALSDPVLPLLTNQTGWWIDTTGTLSPSTQAELATTSTSSVDSVDAEGCLASFLQKTT